ncbi:MAG: hypothetical protein ABI867_37605 [Kofleriaceae bacterium]
MKLAAIVVVAAMVVACGGGRRKPGVKATPEVPRMKTAADRVLALLPDGAQVVVEIDLARLRANPIVGELVTKAIAPGGFDKAGERRTRSSAEGDAEWIDRLPGGMEIADTVVLAAYGLGTSQAATVTVIVAKTAPAEATRISDGIYALGPTEWIAQIEARAAIAANDPTKIQAPKELLALRDQAMPEAAPGAALRITARLPFDARVALARLTGIESAPAQLSLWADVADDIAIVVDAEASDPGDKDSKAATKKTAAKLTAVIRGALAELAKDPAVRAVGLPGSLANAKLVARGTWIRTIIAIGPKHLQRVVERATALLVPKAPS